MSRRSKLFITRSLPLRLPKLLRARSNVFISHFHSEIDGESLLCPWLSDAQDFRTGVPAHAAFIRSLAELTPTHKPLMRRSATIGKYPRFQKRNRLQTCFHSLTVTMAFSWTLYVRLLGALAQIIRRESECKERGPTHHPSTRPTDALLGCIKTALLFP